MWKMSFIPIVLGLAACAAVTQNDVAKAYFGTKPADQFVDAKIKDHLERTLIDPASLRLRCTAAKKGWARDLLEKPRFGYVVLCGVNAKNRLGGYTGEKPIVFLFNDKEGGGVVGPRDDIRQGEEYDYVN